MVKRVKTTKNANTTTFLLERKVRLGLGGASTLTLEDVDDRVAALLQAGSGVTLVYNDGSNTLTISSSGGGGNSYTPSGW